MVAALACLAASSSFLSLGACAPVTASPDVKRDTFEEQCRAKVPPGSVSVTPVPMDPRIDTTVSYRELTQMAGRDGYVWVLGLTRPALRVRAEWGFAGLSDRRSGRTCIRPSLRMKLYYDPVTVFIGREFLEDACAYAFIFRHEMQHVSVHVQRLRKVADHLQRDLQRRLGGAVHFGKRDELQRKLQSEINDYWLPRAERELKDVKQLHAAIDTPEEYARAKTACGGSIARVLSGGAAETRP